jgi:hypothetical protein
MKLARKPNEGQFPRAAVKAIGAGIQLVRRQTPTACLVLLLAMAWAFGGATRSNTEWMAILELVSLACVALIFLTRKSIEVPGRARWPALLFSGFIVVALLQLVPLPWEMWTALPGRETIASGLERLELDGGFRPLSLSPESTISSLLKLIPPLTVFWIALQLPWRTLMTTLVWTVVVIAMFSTLWAIGQVMGAAPHLYAWTPAHLAPGPFANPNHQGTLLLMCLPLIAVLAGQARQNAGIGAGSEQALPWVSVGVFVFIGVIVAGSLFGYLMSPFVIAACGLVGAGNFRSGKRQALGVGLALSVLALVLVVWNSGLDSLGGMDSTQSPQSRSAISADTLDGIAMFAPLGAGLGTFEKAYPLFEDTSAIPRTYVNHAHNEYLQIALEFGAPGVLLMAAFLVWFMASLGATWFTRQEFGSLLRIKMGASVALCVPLLHSILDYPMRAPAVACLAAACMAVLVARREVPRGETERVEVMAAADGEGASASDGVDQSGDGDGSTRVSG